METKNMTDLTKKLTMLRDLAATSGCAADQILDELYSAAMEQSWFKGTETEMSLSVRNDATGLEYAGARGLGGLFASPRTLHPRNLLMLGGRCIHLGRLSKKSSLAENHNILRIQNSLNFQSAKAI